jgi:flagellar basal body-associated protein FliL
MFLAGVSDSIGTFRLKLARLFFILFLASTIFLLAMICIFALFTRSKKSSPEKKE